ncbi:MAG: PQQ-binding-like beta-propeller repeat protein [Proteobacteria bacterium]|nr:PQQ-binding-like beta-propeller repeat protein [Pseudomonadota bacterium]
MKNCLLFVICALLMGCASGGGIEASNSAAPRSAQYDMELDWHYALSPGIGKYLGSTPLELGSTTSAGGVTYVASTTHGKVVAIDEATNMARWTQTFEIPVTAGPVVSGKAVYIALGDGAILKLNAANGSTIWRYESGAAIEHGLSAGFGVVACVNANNRAIVLDDATGAVKWRRERPKSQEFTMYGQSAPLIQEDVTYVGFSDGFLTAYATQNGTAIWTRELAPEARFKDLDVTPLRVDNMLYVATSSGGLYALSADDGHTLWQRDIYGISSIRAFQDSIYVSSQSGIFRIKRKTGDTVWQNIIQKDALISSLELGRNAIYASVQKYGLVVLDRVEGTLLHVIDMGSDFTSAPELTPGVLTTFSNRSTVYRFFVDDIPAG